MEAATLDAHPEFPCTDVFLSIEQLSDAKHELKPRLDEDMLKENLLVEWSVRPVDAEIDD